MGQPSGLPDLLQDELHGETPRFVVREPRALSRRGAGHFALYGVMLLVLAAVMELKGLPREYAIAPALSGVAVILATGIVWMLPGGIAVGTDTRYLHLRPLGLGVDVTSWRAFKAAKVAGDGSVTLERYVRRGRFSWPDDVVKPEDPHAIVGIVERLIREPIAAATTQRAKLGTFSFETTHTPGKRDMLLVRVFGAMIAALGAVMVVFLGVTLFITRDSSAVPGQVWIPVAMGCLMLPAGAWMLTTGRARRRPVRYVADAKALVIRPSHGKEERLPWSEFDGTIERVRRGKRVDLHLPLRREATEHGLRGAREVQDVLQIAGVQDPDEVQAALMRRLAL